MADYVSPIWKKEFFEKSEALMKTFFSFMEDPDLHLCALSFTSAKVKYSMIGLQIVITGNQIYLIMQTKIFI